MPGWTSLLRHLDFLSFTPQEEAGNYEPSETETFLFRRRRGMNEGVAIYRNEMNEKIKEGRKKLSVERDMRWEEGTIKEESRTHMHYIFFFLSLCCVTMLSTAHRASSAIKAHQSSERMEEPVRPHRPCISHNLDGSQASSL